MGSANRSDRHQLCLELVALELVALELVALELVAYAALHRSGRAAA